MNKLVLLCRSIAKKKAKNQHELADELKLSVGSVNTLLKKASEEGLVLREYGNNTITKAGLKWLEHYRVDNAIILAAGMGVRFAPFTYDTPKGLLKVKGMPMLNRQIEQLIDAGITEIVVVVGYLAEKFEYLIDAYGVKLIHNPEFALKNNLSSLYCAREYLGSTYVLAADHWIEESIFNVYEPDSWQCCIPQKGITREWGVVSGAHDLITRIEIGSEDGWAMIGPAYFNREFSETYVPLLEEYYARPGTESLYWENIIVDNLKKLPIYLNRQSETNVFEFENMDELRVYDPNYLDNDENEIFEIISKVFNVDRASIVGIRPMNDGMTNRSFAFNIKGNYYVYRLPGPGTEQLISRSNEKMSYELLEQLNLTDEILYFDGETGVKITPYYNANVGDPQDDKEVGIMMETLRRIHDADYQVDYRFDIGERIEFYEALANERDSILFEDYAEVKACAEELLAFKDILNIPERLCHIDFIYANVLFVPDGQIRVIDWEYAGMADPLIDVAMFSIYAYYDKSQMDRALWHYLQRDPTRAEEARLYLYVALGGFLWSIWTEYKQGLGEEFGDYAIEMYRYMKNYYQILKKGGYMDSTVIVEELEKITEA